jgi:hypothetical protein
MILIFWTDEKVSHLRRLWDDETLSARMIAAELGCSRNAVLGKAHRLELADKQRGPSAASVVSRRLETKRYAERSRKRPDPKSVTVLSSLRGGTFAGGLVLRPAGPDFVAPRLHPGTSKTSPSYRNQLGFLPDMTVRERRDMLAEAVRNTAAMPVEG